MARGKPALWSALLGLPFLLAGGYITLRIPEYPVELGYPFILFGAFIITIGIYIDRVAAPDPPELRDGETMVAVRHPTQRVAAVKFGLSVPFLIVAVYLLVFTMRPYMYPTVALLIGLFLFSKGLHVYWTNTLTKYFVTTERVIKEYRFISLIKQELPLSKVRGVQERRSITESLVGLGNVRVASGEGRTLEITMRNMPQSTKFAESIRDLM